MRKPASPFAQAGLLLALAMACAWIANALARENRRLGWTDRPAALAAAPAPPPSAAPPSAQQLPERFQPDPSHPVRDLAPEDAWLLYGAKTPFLDARRREAYAQGHIDGARNLAVWEPDVDARITEFEAADSPASTAPLVLYCDGGDCEDSRLLAAKLTPLGYRNLFLYRAGYPDWVRRGHPTRTGGRP